MEHTDTPYSGPTYTRDFLVLSNNSDEKIREVKICQVKCFVKEVLMLLVIKLAVLVVVLSNLVAAGLHHPIARLAASKTWYFALKMEQVLRLNQSKLNIQTYPNTKETPEVRSIERRRKKETATAETAAATES